MSMMLTLSQLCLGECLLFLAIANRCPVADQKSPRSRVRITQHICRPACTHTTRNDKGNEFEAEVNELCDLFRIRRVLVDVGTSNSNDTVERLHREVNTMITSDWIQLIPAIHVHLRRQVNVSTGFSPTELEHARDPTYSFAMGH